MSSPNSTDTDFDGLADGQELFVKSVKTPKRYPIQNWTWAFTDNVDVGLAAPAWAVRSMDLMAGLTHPDIGQLRVILDHYRNGIVERQLTLRSYQNGGESNNFTSYDLLNQGVVPAEFLGGGVWYLQAWDNVADLKKGQIEYMQVQVGVHTLPNRADTDADGLNDSEELNLGSDGFSTDPWKADTDGDTLTDNEYAAKGTSPLLADTDRDGVRDDVDRVPLGDAFIEISIDSTYVVGSDSHNSNNMPNPFVKVAIQGNSTYTTPYWDRSAVWYTFDDLLNRYDGHRLSVNVPDGAPTATITVEMWSYDTRGYNEHVPVGIARDTSFGGCSDVNKTTITYPLQGAGQSTAYHLSGGCASSPRYASPLNVTVTTIVPNRIAASLIVPKDYSGVYNVTDAQGGLLGRRYVGEARFVALLLNETTWDNEAGCYCGPAVQVVTLVPRSVFFESRLYAYLNDSNPISPLNKLTFRQNDTLAASNSDVLQQILTGNITTGDAYAIFNLLLENETGYNVRIGLTLTNDLFLFSLPDDAVRFVAYKPPPTAPSWTYTFCSGSCAPTPKPWWELVWTGLLIVAAVLSAVVLPINAFLVLAQILVQVGSWLWTNIVGPGIAAVASAVEAAGEALGQLLDFAWKFVEGILSALFAPVLDQIRAWGENQANLAVQSASANGVGSSAEPPPGDPRDRVTGAVSQFMEGVVAIEALLLAISVGLAVIEIIATVTPGAGQLAKVTSSWVVKALAKGITAAILGTALGAAVARAAEGFIGDPRSFLPAPFPPVGDMILSAEDFVLTFVMHRYLRSAWTTFFEFGAYGPKVFGTIAALKNILLGFVVDFIAGFIPYAAGLRGLHPYGIYASLASLGLHFVSLVLTAHGLNLLRLDHIAGSFLTLTKTITTLLGIIGTAGAAFEIGADILNIQAAQLPPIKY